MDNKSHLSSYIVLLGVHGEGTTVRTLFTLLFWDIIFADGIDDVFCSRFQTFPLDIYTDNFYTSRQAVIEQRLVSISESSDEVIQPFVVHCPVRKKLDEISDKKTYPK